MSVTCVPESQPRDASAEQSGADRFLATRIILGWLLLLGFVGHVAIAGSISENVRAFQVAYGLGFAGFFLLLTAVLSCRSPKRLGRWRWWLLGCVVVRAALLHVDVSDDVHRYLWEGRVQVAGYDPYQLSPGDPLLTSLRDDRWERINHKDYPAIYPPLAQLEFRWVAEFGLGVNSVKALHVLWDLLAVAALAGCLRAVGRSPHLAIAYALCPLVLTAFAIDGHLDSLMLLAVMLSLWALRTDRVHLAGACLGAAVGAKLVAIVLVPWLLFHRPRALIALVASLLALHFLYPSFLLTGLGTLARFGGEAHFFSLLSVVGVSATEGWQSMLIVGVLVVSVTVMARSRGSFACFAAGAMGLMLLLLPVVHYWYFAWVLLFTPFGLRWRWMAGSLAMVVYFEAAHRLAATGVWAMPVWAPILVWGCVALGWGVERRLAAKATTSVGVRC